jgi:hypothetical protein
MTMHSNPINPSLSEPGDYELADDFGPSVAGLEVHSAPPALAPLRAVVAALLAEDPALTTLQPALELLATCRLWPCDRPAGWWIEGAVLEHAYLVVDADGVDLCGCRKFERRGGRCQHVVALDLYRRLQAAP